MEKNFLHKAMACCVGIMTIMGLAGCGESAGEDYSDDSSNGKTLKLKKIDLEGAKYLSLTDSGTKAGEDDGVGLFKIDEEGNVTTVVLSCTEEEDGTITRTRTDIKVIPSSIYSLSGTYTFMENCFFMDGEGRDVYMKQYYEPDASRFNILVRNADGAVFYIPKSLSDNWFYGNYWGGVDPTVLDSKGNLYMFSHGQEISNVGMLTIQNDQLVLKQINPNNVSHHGGKIIPFDNGTVITYRHDDNIFNCSLFYPNGGFEDYCGYQLLEQYPNGRYSDENILPVSKVKSGVMAVVMKRMVVNEQLPSEFTMSLCYFRVGSSYGDHSLSAPIASISSGTDYNADDPQDPKYLDWVRTIYGHVSDWYNGIYETDNKYIIGTLFVVDKRTMEMRPLKSTETNIIFPNADNMYKGRAWSVSASGAEWYDMEMMQHGSVSFNLPSNFRTNDWMTDIPSGKLIVNGTRYADGKSVTYFVDIETGDYVCAEGNSERPITALIPLS